MMDYSTTTTLELIRLNIENDEAMDRMDNDDTWDADDLKRARELIARRKAIRSELERRHAQAVING